MDSYLEDNDENKPSLLLTLITFIGMVFVPVIAIVPFVRRGFPTFMNIMAVSYTVYWTVVVGLFLTGSDATRERMSMPPEPSVIMGKPTKTPAPKPKTIPDRSWSRELPNGRRVTCTIADGISWYLVIPSAREHEMGIPTGTNFNPTKEEWAEFCI